MEKEQKALEKIKNRLIDIFPKLVEDLKLVVQGDCGLYEEEYRDELKLLVFEVFIDGYDVSLYPLDKDSCQLGHRVILNELGDGILAEEGLLIKYTDYNFQWFGQI